MTTPNAISVTNLNTSQLEDLINQATKALSTKTQQLDKQLDKQPTPIEYSVGEELYVKDKKDFIRYY